MASYEEIFKQMASSVREEGFLADAEQMGSNRNRAKGQYKRLGDLHVQLEQGHRLAGTMGFGPFAQPASALAGGSGGLDLPSLPLQAGVAGSVYSSSGSHRSLGGTPTSSGRRSPPQLATAALAMPPLRGSIRSPFGTPLALTPLGSAPATPNGGRMVRSSSAASVLSNGSGANKVDYLERSWRTQKNAYASGF